MYDRHPLVCSHAVAHIPVAVVPGPIKEPCNCATTHQQPNGQCPLPPISVAFLLRFSLILISWVTLEAIANYELLFIDSSFKGIAMFKSICCEICMSARARACLCRWSAMKLIASLKYFKKFHTHFLSHSTGSTKIRLSRNICLIQTLSA